MNALEAGLLDRSMGRLSDTFLRNRMMAEESRQHNDRMGLSRDELSARMADRDETRAAQMEQKELLAQIQRESKELQQRHYEMMEAAGVFDKLQAGLANGTIKIDALKAQFAENPMLKRLGLSADIFQQPAAKKFNTREGHNLELAEQYRERAAAAAGPAGGGNSDRYLSIAERLERGGAPEPDPMAEVTEEVGEVDPLSGKGAATVRRKIPASQVEDLMRQRLEKKKPAAAPSDQFETVAEAHEAGKKAGDVIMLWDPQQKRYRKFQLE